MGFRGISKAQKMSAHMQTESVKIKDFFVVQNEKGLHTRPATELVKCTSTFKANITLSLQDLTVNAKSLLGILMLAASRGSKVKIEAIGIDAEDAVKSLIELASNKFYINY